MSKPISEQEILDLIKELDQQSIILGQDWMKAAPAADSDTGVDEDRSNGFVQVENGRIIVGNPSNRGEFPTIQAESPITILVDGGIIHKEAVVTAESIIEWKLEEKPLFEISFSEDQIEAYLTIHRTHRYACTLLDTAPALHAALIVTEDHSALLETLKLTDVFAAVFHLNIKKNLDTTAILAELSQPTYRTITIARGKAPIQGQDAQLDMYFSEEIKNRFTETRGTVDYKNHMNIPSVKNGDIIAKKTPAIEGYAGYDVFGNELLPEPVRDIRIVGKQNVEITDDGVVIARKEGRPRVTGSQIKYFDINTAYIVQGNVDIRTGNIVFAGDVVVYGDVTDNMIIESLGNIYVSGSVFNATLTATGSIAVKRNVIGSNLYSGYFGIMYNRFYSSCKQLVDMLEKMDQSADLLLAELSKKNKKVRYGQVLLLIIENKYPHVWAVVKELLDVLSNVPSIESEAVQPLKNDLELFLQPARIVEAMTAPKLGSFLRYLKQAFMTVVLSQETFVQISINQAQKSNLKSNGDIYIRKEGIIQCDLYSSGNIVFMLNSSVCRGSRLEAGDTISAMYVGGSTGVRTSLKAAKKIMVKKLYEGRISIDRYTVDIIEPVVDRMFDRNNMKQMV